MLPRAMSWSCRLDRPANSGTPARTSVRSFMANLTSCACEARLPGIGWCTGHELATYVTTGPPKTTTGLDHTTGAAQRMGVCQLQNGERHLRTTRTGDRREHTA